MSTVGTVNTRHPNEFGVWRNHLYFDYDYGETLNIPLFSLGSVTSRIGPTGEYWEIIVQSRGFREWVVMTSKPEHVQASVDAIIMAIEGSSKK